MRVAIIGAGRIGAGIARQLARSDHELALAFSRDPESLQRLAAEIGPRVAASTPREAIGLAEVVVLSVPWDAIDLALGQAGPLHGKIVIDTTNHFGASPGPTPGQTAAQFNARRMQGARHTKAFNTLTAAFQARSAGRTGAERVVQWLCGDDEDAKRNVAGLIATRGLWRSTWAARRGPRRSSLRGVPERYAARNTTSMTRGRRSPRSAPASPFHRLRRTRRNDPRVRRDGTERQRRAGPAPAPMRSRCARRPTARPQPSACPPTASTPALDVPERLPALAGIDAITWQVDRHPRRRVSWRCTLAASPRRSVPTSSECSRAPRAINRTFAADHCAAFAGDQP